MWLISWQVDDEQEELSRRQGPTAYRVVFQRKTFSLVPEAMETKSSLIDSFTIQNDRKLQLMKAEVNL